jgi:hypothetical protein
MALITEMSATTRESWEGKKKKKLRREGGGKGTRKEVISQNGRLHDSSDKVIAGYPYDD